MLCFFKCEGDECRAEFNTVNFFGEICDTECIELCSDLYNITKNDICVGALKRDEFAVAVAVAAICWYFLLLPSLPLWFVSSRSVVFVKDHQKRE